MKRHYEAHKGEYYEKNRAKRQKMAAWLAAYKTGKQCADCEIVYPHYAMDFDRIDPTTKINIVGHFVEREVGRG